MSNNPDDSELLSLGIDVDASGFNELKTHLDGIDASLGKLGEGTQARLDALLYRFDKLSSEAWYLKEVFSKTGEQLDTLAKSPAFDPRLQIFINSFAKGFDNTAEQVEELNKQLSSAKNEARALEPLLAELNKPKTLPEQGYLNGLPHLTGGTTSRTLSDEYLQLKKRIDDLIESSGGFGAALEREDIAAIEFISRLNEIQKAAFDNESLITQYADEIERLANSYRKASAAGADFFGGYSVNEYLKGYGVSGGMIGPAEASEPVFPNGYTLSENLKGYGVSGGMIGPAEASGVSQTPGGRGGSLIGLAFGLQSAGNLGKLLGADESFQNALRGAGDITFLVQSLQDLQKVVPALNSAIMATPGLLGPIVSGFTALGIPMAGVAAAFAPIAAVVAAAAVAIKGYNDALERGKEAAERAKNALDAEYDAKRKTSAQIQQDIADEEVNRRLLIHKLFDQQLLKLKAEQEGGPLGGLNAELQGKLHAFDEQIKQTTIEINASIDAQKGYEASLNSNEVAANDARERIVGFGGQLRDTAQSFADAWDQWITKVSQFTIQKAQESADYARQIAADQKMNPEQLQERLNFLQQEGAILEWQASQLAPYIKDNEALAAIYNGLMTTVNNYKNEIIEITDRLLPQAQATQDVSEQVKIATDLWDKIGKAIGAFNKGAAELAQETFDKITEAQAKELRAEQELQEGSLQDVQQRAKIMLDAERKETAARLETAQKIEDINRKLAEKQDDLNLSLARALEDDTIKYNQDRAKIIRSAQEQELDDRLAHEQKLAQLSKVSNLDIEDALLDRNFLEINQQKKRQQESIQQEVQSYSQRQAAQRRHTAQQLHELGIAHQQQQQQDRLAAARRLQDAQIAHTREIQTAVIAEGRKIATIRLSEQQQLIDLTTAEQNKIAILRQSLRQQIDLLMYEQRLKTQIAQAQMQQIVQTAAGALGQMFFNNPGAVIQSIATPQGITGVATGLASLFGTAMKFFDQGGAFGAGEPFVMSENRPETLGFGPQSYMIPGAAMVLPLQSGSVGRNAGNSMSQQNNFYIQSNDPDGVKREVLTILKQVMA